MTPISLSSVGVTPAVLMMHIDRGSGLAPSILVILSSGASLTYTVEVTGADFANNVAPPDAFWTPFDGMSGLSASANGTLAAMVIAVRCRITSYSSGSLNFAVVQ
jgi:hypothetical protein